jgi:predicted nucleotidyltransferase
MTEKILFITEVGSYMWGMGTPESDHDHMVIFQQSTSEILYGYAPKTGRPQKKYFDNGIEYDCQYMEIGHLVNLLIKGNVNAIWTATSPIIVQDNCPIDLLNLRSLVYSNLSKASYASINGMAGSQFKASIRRKIATNMTADKAYKTCLRTLNFGITMFDTGKLVYAPVDHTVTIEEINEAFEELERAYERTHLPAKPNEQDFRKFLHDLRVDDMR